MATVVLDINIDPLPESISGLEKFENAYVVFRMDDIPVSGFWFDVKDGKLELQAQLKKILLLSECGITDVLLRRKENYSGNDPSATIAICTRNRTEDLRKCLHSLMQLNNIGQEILVVDNAPDDTSTFDLVKAEFPNVQYVLETNPGLNVARNRAIKEASKEIVAFIDDDAVTDKNWLTEILKPFDKDRVACVTGMTQPLELIHEGQVAFEKYSPFCKGYRRRVFDTSVNPLATGEVGAGVNMAIRKSIVDQIGGFDESLDAGTPTQSGGDHEYFTRILRSGYYIFYEPAALNWHRHRRTMIDARKAIYGYGVGMYAYWTKLLVKDREWWILKQAIQWFYYHQLRHMIKSIFRIGNHHPVSLIWAEWRGCFRGPSAYLESIKKLRSKHAEAKNIRRHSYA